MAPALKTLKLTRRRPIGGLVPALSCSALAGPRGEPDFDVLIIGAGAAGIAAGRRLLATNKKFAILEASDRMGGRCFTDTATFKLPYDRGACSIHLPAALRVSFQTIFGGQPILGGKLSNFGFDQIAKNRIELRSRMRVIVGNVLDIWPH
jgi:hypothetical protein